MKFRVFCVAFVLGMLILAGCQNYTADKVQKETKNEEFEKGYNLPIEDNVREEIELDCKEMLEKVREIYVASDKGDASNVVISDEAAYQMLEVISEVGCPTTISVLLSDMSNYEKVERFLCDSADGKEGEILLYDINLNGGINRQQFIFDGRDMYILETAAKGNEENKPIITYTSFCRIKEWKYTEKGWFSYEYCVPEPPEVTEIVDGEELLRVRPLKKEFREMADKYLMPLGYQGNNMLCSNWNTEHMEDIDYNGLYEYLYTMKYEKSFDRKLYSNGIPKEEFESTLMEYLPITSEQLQKYAAYDKENQRYLWARLGCGNYAPKFFGTSFPEITNIKENDDGTVTLTVDAVCEMLGTDEVMSHQLTIKFLEDGSFQYLGNKILGDGLKHIPEYQYRIRKG